MEGEANGHICCGFNVRLKPFCVVVFIFFGLFLLARMDGTDHPGKDNNKDDPEGTSAEEPGRDELEESAIGTV
jgi:hypothetical protein